jgi:hypothetical protein
MLANVELNCPASVEEPMLETANKVVETPVLEVEAIAKRLASTEVDAACTPKVANMGVDEPTVRAPRLKVLPVVVAPPLIVSPPACVPLPMVVEAKDVSPPLN